jgi:uncharacterized damage-inducible protein DinB
MDEALIQTWQIHNRIVLFMLNGIAPEALADAAAPRQRTVGDHLAHIHNVRLMWLKVAAPELMEGLGKVEKAAEAELLRTSLEASGKAIEELLRRSDGKIKGFKPHAAAFVGYLISHEGYHSGKVDMILRMNGHALDDKVHYGMWEWGVR